MARLNEAPLPVTESIDALKRRFVRQNREIARVNSTQSVRIRNLECEISRLLGENASLREETIRLHYELEKSTSKGVLDSVDAVKGRLENKLLEIGNLLNELGGVQKAAETKEPRRPSALLTSPKRSPDQKRWRNTLTFSEVIGSGEGRLPPIVEGKCYPRRTLSAEELGEALNDPANVTDSPDLGPPPVAHFEAGDPIKFDADRADAGGQPPSSNVADNDARFSANLETRKKRRESSNHRDGRTSESSTQPPDTIVFQESGLSTEPPLRIGAKRKLNVHEEDTTSEAAAGREDDLLRKDTAGQSADGRNSKLASNRASKVTESKPGQTASASAHRVSRGSAGASGTAIARSRKALEPKSVNRDTTNSPLKIRSEKEKGLDVKENNGKPVQGHRMTRESRLIKVAKKDKPEVGLRIEDALKAAGAVEVPPETPLPPLNDILSPALSNPSAPRAQSNDTPPPPDLASDTGTGSFGRASRRPRGSVNYAQPNLRDKMRRPTAELVDAVAAEERARQASIARAEGQGSMIGLMKQEDVTNGIPTWKTNDPKESYTRKEEPASPLGNKKGDSSIDLLPNVTTERRGRTSAPLSNLDDSTSVTQPSGAATAIAALTVKGQRPKKKEAENHEAKAIRDQEIPEPFDRPSIYDFTGSSPHNADDASIEPLSSEVVKTARPSRRHSSVPSSMDQGNHGAQISRRGERRKESTVVRQNEVGDEKRLEGERVLLRTKSVREIKAGVDDPAMSKGERAASRRRSMML